MMRFGLSRFPTPLLGATTFVGVAVAQIPATSCAASFPEVLPSSCPAPSSATSWFKPVVSTMWQSPAQPFVIGEQRRFASTAKPKKLLTGKTLVFTGTISMPRNEAKAMAIRSGATVVKKFSSNVTNVVVGSGAGSKLSKAQAKGVVLWTEKEFMEKLTVEDHKERLGDNKGRIITKMSKASYQFSLAWDALVDLDIKLQTPAGLISYMNKRVGKGHLDVDRIPDYDGTPWKKRPVENIVCDKADPGFYRASIVWFSNGWGQHKVSAPIPYTVHCRVGKDHGAVLRNTSTKLSPGHGDQKVGDTVCTFEVQNNGEVKNVKFGAAAKNVKPPILNAPATASAGVYGASSLRGKTVVFTGTLSMQRSQAAAKALAAGATVTKDVSRGTGFLVCGAGAGSKKTAATTLGVKVLTEAQFLRLV